ncbi:hypothetical protein [Muriicola sp.]|uniref:hypothetical protein n=1 Tax=Muriicola sp. TaxID=2020856 RepID=UPI003C74C6CB
MDLVQSLLDYLKKDDHTDNKETPLGLCPNCWGTQEYGGKFYEASKNYDADVKTPNPNIGWIRDYANKHLAGIALQSHEEGQVCEHCKVVYTPEK